MSAADCPRCLEKLTSQLNDKTSQNVPETTDAFLKAKGCQAKYWLLV